METINIFLESSSIHGMTYLSPNGRHMRLFWIAVIISGFVGSGILIYQSFQSWSESPVSTTIETRPITEFVFPKVTVCPPKNTYTDLNYDLLRIENMTLDNDMRKELTNYAKEVVYDNSYETLMLNLSKLQDPDRFYNWYNGFTEIDIPRDYTDFAGYIAYDIFTSSTSGSISTQFFGKQFEPHKVEQNIEYQVRVYPPTNISSYQNVTLHLEMERVSLKNILSEEGRDNIRVAK